MDFTTFFLLINILVPYILLIMYWKKNTDLELKLFYTNEEVTQLKCHFFNLYDNLHNIGSKLNITKDEIQLDKETCLILQSLFRSLRSLVKLEQYKNNRNLNYFAIQEEFIKIINEVLNNNLKINEIDLLLLETSLYRYNIQTEEILNSIKSLKN